MYLCSVPMCYTIFAIFACVITRFQMINKHGRMMEIEQIISDSPVLPRASGVASRDNQRAGRAKEVSSTWRVQQIRKKKESVKKPREFGRGWEY